MSKPEALVYLTGASTAGSRALRRPDLGLLVTPDTAAQYAGHIADYPTGYAIDNGCFTNPDRDLDAFLRLVDGLPRAGCRFAVAPDVVGDMAATWARSAPALDRIRQLGVPAALVAQPGIALVSPDGGPLGPDAALVVEATGEPIPWDAFDVLFLGGDDRWKLRLPGTRMLVWTARARGVPVHMGRVNSFTRLWLAQVWGCTSADGTFLAFGPDANLPRLIRWLDDLPTAPLVGGVSTQGGGRAVTPEQGRLFA